MKRKSTDYVCFLKGLFADLGGLLVSFSLLVLVESFRRLNRKIGHPKRSEGSECIEWMYSEVVFEKNFLLRAILSR
jgi:hypothetical protein